LLQKNQGGVAGRITHITALCLFEGEKVPGTNGTVLRSRAPTPRPSAPEAPGFGTRVGRTFSGSLEALQGFGQGVIIVAVAMAPWLPVIALVVAPFWWLIRRLTRTTARPTVPVLDVAPVQVAPPAPTT